MKPYIALTQCVLIVLAVSGALVSPRVIYTSGEREYDRNGFVNDQRLARWYRPIQGENAADYYLQAIRGVLNNPDLSAHPDLLYVELPDSGHPWSSDQTASARELASSARPVLDNLDRATRINVCRFPVCHEGDGRLNLNRQHVGLRRCVRLLTAVAIVEAHDGRVEEAVRRVVQIGRLADVVAQEPDLIAIPVSCGIRSKACDLARWLIHTYPLSDEDLARIADSLPDQTGLPRWYVDEAIHSVASPGVERVASEMGKQVDALRRLIVRAKSESKR